MTALLKTLPNGVRLLAVPMPHVQSASVGVFLRVGSRDESPHTNGFSHVREQTARASQFPSRRILASADVNRTLRY